MSAPEGESIVDRVINGETSRQERTRQKGAVCFEFERDGEETRARIAQDIDPSYSDAITASEPDAREYADKLPEHPLPGAGEKGDDCGQLIPGLGCDCCWRPQEVGRTCRSPDCPRCNKSWVFHRAVDMGAKMHDLAKKVPEQVFKHHLTVSFRDSTRFNSQDPMKRGMQAVKSLLHLADVQTGYAIYHPYRIVKEYRGDVLGHDSGDGDMTWKDVLEKLEGDSWSWEAVREEFLVYAPHFHIVCLAGFVDTTGQDGPDVGEIEDKTGVVLHRITTKRKDGKERSIADVDELARVLGYSLSHAGIAPESEKQTHRADIRAFGQVANHDVSDTARSRMEVKEAMRKAAPKVLGIEFPDPSCNHSIPKDRKRGDDGHIRSHGAPAGSGSSKPDYPVLSGSGAPSDVSRAAGGSSGGGGDSWSETSGMVPGGLSVPTDDQSEPCDGKLVPIWKLEPRLGDLEEVNRVESRFGQERVHELRKAVERWHELGEPSVDTPDSPGDSPDE